MKNLGSLLARWLLLDPKRPIADDMLKRMAADRVKVDVGAEGGAEGAFAFLFGAA
jgi:hypothetical protein